MRRPERDHMGHRANPILTLLIALESGAAGHEPTHAVPDDHELGQRHRPEIHEAFEPLGECAPAVAVLRWLYRWPLFVPFIVAGQIMRSFLAKNGLMNHGLIELGLLTPLQAQSFIDWRGVVVAFVWKQTPFVTLMVAGAMATQRVDRALHQLVDDELVEARRQDGKAQLATLQVAFEGLDGIHGRHADSAGDGERSIP